MMIIKSFSQDNLLSLCMKIINLVRVMETEKVLATTSFIT